MLLARSRLLPLQADEYQKPRLTPASKEAVPIGFGSDRRDDAACHRAQESCGHGSRARRRLVPIQRHGDDVPAHGGIHMLLWLRLVPTGKGRNS